MAAFSPSELRAARLANGGRYPEGAKVVRGLPIKAIHGGGMGTLVVQADGMTCAFLVEGRCSIYEARPLVCRDYGIVPEMPCQVVDPKGAEREAERMIGDLIKIRGTILEPSNR